MLWGRDDDRAAVEAALDAARSGRSAVLVIMGEPGIGKTSLLTHAAERAEGMTVLRGTGIETEAEIPFASLHLLLRRALGRVDALPPPQAAALKGAFGLAPAAGDDQLLVGLAVLSLLADLAEDGPLLCLVDDAHWLDQSSAYALRFAAHRLHAEGITMIFGARDGFDPTGLPEHRLTGLDGDSAHLLLDATAPGLTEPARRRIIEESCGNPLALLELPKVADPGPSPLPLPERLQSAYAARIAELPADARTALLVTALTDGGELDVILRAGTEPAALAAAERAGLIRIAAGQVTFTHPLMRAAATRLGTFDLRIDVHRRLAGLVREDDRRAWHLASAATGPDEDAADALEQAARRARDRSGH
ncbi:MAG: AAA family ATPase, partial [Hamadaea sp.]|nr:AAA family ATPase [Hamadaea sp.]